MIHPRHLPASTDVARHYDELDRFYREVWGEHVHHGLWNSGRESAQVAVRQLVERVADEAHLRPGDRICDVGAGYGATARLLAQEYDVRVTALTLSRTQYEYARSLPHRPGDPTYLLCDWLDNDFAPGTFDAVLTIECISHVEDKQAFLNEAFRVLRPGGRFVLCAWLSGEDPKAWEVSHLLEPICREGRLPGLATEPEYRSMMTSTGFSLTRVEDLSRQVHRTWTICIRHVMRGLLTRPHFIRYLLDGSSHNRRSLLTPFRIWLAYRTGALRYGLFAARKP